MTNFGDEGDMRNDDDQHCDEDDLRCDENDYTGDGKNLIACIVF